MSGDEPWRKGEIASRARFSKWGKAKVPTLFAVFFMVGFIHILSHFFNPHIKPSGRVVVMNSQELQSWKIVKYSRCQREKLSLPSISLLHRLLLKLSHPVPKVRTTIPPANYQPALRSSSLSHWTLWVKTVQKWLRVSQGSKPGTSYLVQT